MATLQFAPANVMWGELQGCHIQKKIEEGYFEYGNFEFENGNFEK